MSNEMMDRIAAIVREAMDYAADHGRIATPEDYADRIRETLATPAAGEDDLADLRTRLAEYVEDWDTQPMHAAWSSRVAIGPREARALLALLDQRAGNPAAGEDVRDEIARILCEVAQEAHDDAPHVGPGPMYVPSDFGGHADRILALLRAPSGEGEACPDCEGRGLIQRGLGSDCVVDCELCRTTGRAPGVAEYRRLMRELRDAEYELAALRSEAPGEGGRTVTIPTFQPGDRVMVDWAHYRGPGVVERDDHYGEVLVWRNGALAVRVRPWIGSWEDGYPHNFAWLYPVDRVRAARRGEGGGE